MRRVNIVQILSLHLRRERKNARIVGNTTAAIRITRAGVIRATKIAHRLLKLGVETIEYLLRLVRIHLYRLADIGDDLVTKSARAARQSYIQIACLERDKRRRHSRCRIKNVMLKRLQLRLHTFQISVHICPIYGLVRILREYQIDRVEEM